MTALPTYAEALTVPTVDEEEAALIASFPALVLAGWPEDAPQRAMVFADASALQFEMIQRAAIAYASSPAQVRKLRSFLIEHGYEPAEAAALASAWVDVTLTIYQTPRLPATFAYWQIPVKAASTQTIDGNTNITLQADDGTFFVNAQSGSSAVLNSGNAYKGTVTFVARDAGSTGNVTPGTITKIVQGFAGLQIDLTLAQKNLTPARDAESDDDALARGLARLGTLSGILTAAGWRYVMQTPAVGGDPTITSVFVDDQNPNGPNSVAITVANATGAPTTAQLATAKAQGVRFTIAGGGNVSVGAALVLTVAIVATLKTDGSNPLASAQAVSKLAQFAPGEILYVDAVVALLMGITGVVNVSALSLAADVVRPSNGVMILSGTVDQT